MKQKQSFRKPRETDCIVEHFEDDVEQSLNYKIQRLSKKNNTHYQVLYRYHTVQVVTIKKQQEWNKYLEYIEEQFEWDNDRLKYPEPFTEIHKEGYSRVILQDEEGTIKRFYFNWNKWKSS